MRISESFGKPTRRPKLWLWLAGGITVVVLLVWSVAYHNNTGSSPTTEGGDDRSNSADADGKFEPDPVFDKYQRVVYVPLEKRGVILSSTTSSALSRSDTQKPDGIMLQRVHGDMVLPFSTSDGPTGFTDAGIATGFSHTPQGAALAGIHYLCWLMYAESDPTLYSSLTDIAGPKDYLEKKASEPASSQTPAAKRRWFECTPRVVKVTYDPALTRIAVGYAGANDRGETVGVELFADLVWHDGWSLKINGEVGRNGTGIRFDAKDGWLSWFA